MLLDRIEAVTVCVGYGDFLAATAPVNAHIFDQWLIVTTPDDEVTRDVCRKHSLPTLLTEDGRAAAGDGGAFKKGRMIERGLRLLSADGWRVHMDADIALPSRTRHLLQAAEPDPDKIYGCDRVLCQSWDEWQLLLHTGYLTHQHHDYHNRVRWPAGLKPGARWADLATGYVPIGFFQLWNGKADLWKGTRVRPYPSLHNDACRTDVQHGLQWDRRQRELLAELIAVHLESHPAPMGVNWRGRKTRWFGPPGVTPGYPIHAADKAVS